MTQPTEPHNPRITFEYDPETRAVTWRGEPGFPPALAVNALELAKYYYLEIQIAKVQPVLERAPHTQQHVVGPDGMPLPP